jgi:hypothetical protein
MPERYPTTLTELFDALGQKVLAGQPQVEILQWLFGFSQRYGFRLRYDGYRSGEFDPKLVRLREQKALEWHSATNAASAPSAPELKTVTYEEYEAEKKRKAEVLSKATVADEPVKSTADEPEKSTTDEPEKSTVDEPEKSTTDEPVKSASAKPQRTPGRKNRGVAMSGREWDPAFVESAHIKDPAVRAPRGSPPRAGSSDHSRRRRGGRGRDSSRGHGGGRGSHDIPANLITYLESGETIIGRVLLYRENRGLRTHGRALPIENEFGSLTIDAISWRPLAITPRPFARQIHKGAVNQYIEDDLYEIVRTNDGSLGTLYKWCHVREGPIWCLATQRGYDVFPLTWAGGDTWAEMLDKLLADPALAPADGLPGKSTLAEAIGAKLTRGRLSAEDCRLDFDALDDTRCYTIGMREHGVQALLADPVAVWSVQSVDLGEGSDFQPNFAIGVPAFPCQSVISPEETQLVTVASLQEMCNTSRERAVAAIRDGCVGFEHFDYGYILRSKDRDATGEDSDIIIESPLLNEVRGMYSPAPSSSPDSERITPHNRLRYSAMRGLLNETRRQEILDLFPQYSELDNKAREFLGNVQHYVIERSRQTGIREPAAAGPPRHMSVTSLGNEVLAAIFEKFPNFNGFERGVAEVTVRGFLYDSLNAMFVLAAIGLA